ncbi:hypothetical protein EON64_20525, partial [archaeon]
MSSNEESAPERRVPLIDSPFLSLFNLRNAILLGVISLFAFTSLWLPFLPHPNPTQHNNQTPTLSDPPFSQTCAEHNYTAIVAELELQIRQHYQDQLNRKVDEIGPQMRSKITSEMQEQMSKQLQEQVNKAHGEYKSQFAEAVQAYERQLGEYRQTIQTLQERQTEMLSHLAEMNTNCSSMMAKQSIQLAEACKLNSTERMRALRTEFSQQLAAREGEWQGYLAQCNNVTARAAHQVKQTVEVERKTCERRLEAQRDAYQRVYNETYFITLCNNNITRGGGTKKEHGEEHKKSLHQALSSSHVVEPSEEDPYHYDVDFALVTSGVKILTPLT